MNNILFAFKTRLFVVSLFLLFFVFLILLSLFAKNRTQQAPTTSAVPTLVPVVISPGATSSFQRPSIEKSSGANSNSLGVVTFDISPTSLPSSGTIYIVTPSTIPTDIISQIKSSLVPGGTEKIISTPKGPVNMITNAPKTLIIYPYSRTITYSTTSPDQKSVNKDSFVDQARDFIASLSLSIDASSPEIGYYSNKTSDLTPAASISDADVIDVSFRESLRDIVIYRQFGSDSRTHVWFTKDGAIFKFTYLYPPVYQPKTTVALPTLPDAQNSIQKEEGTIVSLGANYQQNLLKNPDSTIFTKVSFGYFSDSKNSLLSPVYVFSGTSIIQGVKYPIIVYLPVGQGN